MTKFEKIKNTKPLGVKLRCFEGGDLKENFIVEVIPQLPNSFIIRDKNYKGSSIVSGSSIHLSSESAIELAKFLKETFLDEDKSS